MKPNILIAVPAYGDLVRRDCLASVFAITKALTTVGINTSLATTDIGDVVIARNRLAAMMLADSAITHALFLDNDMGIQATAIQKMLNADTDVIGVASPQRKLPLKFTVGKFIRNVSKGVSEHESVGAAVMLVRRTAFEKLKPHVVRKVYEGDSANAELFGFFDRVVVDGHEKSEDYSFCYRWRTVGGKILVVTDETVSHIGSFSFTGRYDEQVKPPIATPHLALTPKMATASSAPKQ